MQGITQACFGLSYLFAFGLEAAGLRVRSFRLAAVLFGAAGLVAHTAYLAIHQPSPASPGGSLLLLAWVLAVFGVYGSLHHPKQAWAVFVLPVVLGLIALSIMLERTAVVSVPTWLHGERLWGAIHGLLLLLAAVGISVSFVAGVMYLLQARRVRKKLPPLGGLHLLSLERLDAMTRRGLNAAVPLLTAGLILGGLLLKREHSVAEGWQSLKIVGTVGLWLVCLLLVVLRYAAHLPAKRVARLSILAFGLMLLSLAASHPFAEAP